jgi:hypothetical protein
VKLHLICSTNRVPISYELTAANAAEVLLVRELLAGAGLEEGTIARRLFGDLAYRSARLKEELAEAPACCFRPSAPSVARRSASRL